MSLFDRGRRSKRPVSQEEARTTPQSTGKAAVSGASCKHPPETPGAGHRPLSMAKIEGGRPTSLTFSHRPESPKERSGSGGNHRHSGKLGRRMHGASGRISGGAHTTGIVRRGQRKCCEVASPITSVVRLEATSMKNTEGAGSYHALSQVPGVCTVLGGQNKV
jgi:hypothetical protein